MDRRYKLSQDTLYVISEFLEYRDIMSLINSDIVSFGIEQYERWLEFRQRMIQKEQEEFIKWWNSYQSKKQNHHLWNKHTLETTIFRG